jgi:AraC-like DNA-binding protein
MPVNILIVCLCFCFSITLKAPAVSVQPDSLLYILKIDNQDLKERKLSYYLETLFGDARLDSLDVIRDKVDRKLLKNNVVNRAAFQYLIDGLCLVRNLHYNEAENALTKAIELANKSGDDYLQYAFFTYLGFIQTNSGKTIDAISSFRMAKKEAVRLNDTRLEVVIDINISDIYYRNGFYTQSLFYLNQALAIIAEHPKNIEKYKNVIFNNKSENYFRMNNIDSLKKYYEILSDRKSWATDSYRFRKRTGYYLYLLRHDYKNAVRLITSLQKDPLYNFDNTDKQNLSDAYYNSGKLDSARYLINQLLAGQEQNNHPEIKYHLYSVLGEIAEKENDYINAASNFKLALQQSEDNISRLTQVGNVSSQIKIDEIAGSYIQKEASYKRERLWLIFMVVVALLIIAIVVMFYRNIIQKRYYEKLLFTTKKEELAFINSHEVRRHLSNILGIIEVMKHSEIKDKEYLQAESHLLSAARDLDTAIKNISEKLDN